MKENERARFWRAFVATLLLGLLLVTPALRAQTVRDNGLEEPAGGPLPVAPPETAPEAYQSPLVIPAADFSSDGINEPGDYFFSFPLGYLTGVDDITTNCLQAPVYLPHGATVTSIYASVLDETETGGMFLNLYRVDNFSAGNADRMAQVFTTDAETAAGIVTKADLSVEFAGVIYPNYSYYAGVCLDADVRLYSLRVYYTE